MIEVEYCGSVYSGRLISLTAIESEIEVDGCNVIKNKAYDLVLMDANGAVIYLLIEDPQCIKWW